MKKACRTGAPIGFEKAIRLPDGRLAIAMEYAPHGHRTISGYLNARQKDVLAYDILAGLALKEKAGVTHRDVKGPNILSMGKDGPAGGLGNRQPRGHRAFSGGGEQSTLARPELTRLEHVAAAGPRRELKRLKDVAARIKKFANAYSKKQKKAFSSQLAASEDSWKRLMGESVSHSGMAADRWRRASPFTSTTPGSIRLTATQDLGVSTLTVSRLRSATWTKTAAGRCCLPIPRFLNTRKTHPGVLVGVPEDRKSAQDALDILVEAMEEGLPNEADRAGIKAAAAKRNKVS